MYADYTALKTARDDLWSYEDETGLLANVVSLAETIADYLLERDKPCWVAKAVKGAGREDCIVLTQKKQNEINKVDKLINKVKKDLNKAKKDTQVLSKADKKFDKKIHKAEKVLKKGKR